MSRRAGTRIRYLRPATTLLGCSILAAGVTAALAASPKKGGLYSGKIVNPAGTEKTVSLHVARSGTTASATLFCTGVASGIARFHILHGRFIAVSRLGSVVRWRMTGRFLSATRIHVSLVASSICDGRGGYATLKLSGT